MLQINIYANRSLDLTVPFELKMDIHLDSEPLTLRFLRTFRDLLRFVLFTYTVLFGALILAGWTTYFIVAK